MGSIRGNRREEQSVSNARGVTNRLQVLVDGNWVDVANVSPAGEIDQTRPQMEGMSLGTGWSDEAPPAPMPSSWRMSMTIAPDAASSLFEIVDQIARHDRADRARRRLWLRYPFRPSLSRCARVNRSGRMTA